MALTDMIQLGNRIDIKQQLEVEAEENGGEKAPVYQSKVVNFLSEEVLEIAMPVLDGQLILLQLGAACDFVFFAKRGMYRGSGVVKKRYRKENTAYLAVSLPAGLVKFQRREFFRIDYLAEMEYYEIDEETAGLKETEDLLAAVVLPEAKMEAQKGTIQDISGGGVRFLSEKLYEKGDFLLMKVVLDNGWYAEKFMLVGEIVGSEAHTSLEGKYTNRVKFLFKDLKDREKIVRFVFDEERRLRKKGVG